MNIKEEDNKFVSRGCSEMPSIYHKNDNIYSHRCCKMDVYDWLDDIPTPVGQKPFDIVEVRFKNSRKDFFITDPETILDKGDIVAVESTSGHDIGIVTLIGESVKLQLKKKHVKIDSQTLKKVYRRARLPDIEKWVDAINHEQNTMIEARRLAGELKLNMKINDVEFQGDNAKATFYYTAEDRVDFRELIKVLAERFHIRIEMKQIGVRQEASRVGGIGSCGRELCCSTWLGSFKSVSTQAARVQQLSLNPQKLAGQCAKLKCCLNYELSAYEDQLKDFPDTNIVLKTTQGDAYFSKIDVFKKIMWYSCRSINGNSLLPLSIDQVKKLIALNKEGHLPEKMDDFLINNDEKSGYENQLNQEDLTRFDKKTKKPVSRNKRRPNNRPTGNNKAQDNSKSSNDSGSPSAKREKKAPSQNGGKRTPKSRGRSNNSESTDQK